MSDSLSRATACETAAQSPGHAGDFLISAARRFPRSGIRVIRSEHDESTLLTYPALLDEALRIAGGLRAAGYATGSKVALLLERTEDFVAAFWGSLLGGYAPCTLVPIRNDAERWARYLAHVNTLLENPVVITTASLQKDVPGMSSVEIDALRAAQPLADTDWPQPEQAAMVVLTSGSTGNPKAVALTHANLLASMAGKQHARALQSDDKVLNWIPFDHVASLLESHMIAVCAGARWLHIDAPLVLADPLLLLRLIDRLRITHSLMPNFLLGQINTALEVVFAKQGVQALSGLDLSCIRHIITGGEANVVETGQRFIDMLAPLKLPRTALWPGFGMTETCAGIIYSKEFPHSDTAAGREFGAVGFPVPGVEIRIADDNGDALPAGEAGELQLRGPMIFGGYLNNAEETRAAFSADGWFRTGDSGMVEAGRLHLVGRNKDCIIVSGINYYSQELEAVLESLEGIERSYVAAFPTRPKGADTEQLVIMFSTSIPPADEERLYQLLVAVRNTTVLLWGFRPTLMLPVPQSTFTRTSLGKIQRAQLRKRLEAGEFVERINHIAELTTRQLGGFAAPENPVEAEIAEIFANMFDIDAGSLSVSASFFDLGGTSLDIIKLTRTLGQRFGMADVTMATILQHPTARALAAHVIAAQRGDREQRPYQALVPLQLTGAKTPLFCVHSAIGEILVFVNLAKYFVNERPFHAFRTRGLNEGEPYFDTLEEMVESYIAAMRKIQPRGPYALAGYSFGGLAAFEMAKRLEAEGEQVSFLCSIDCAPGTIEPICPDYCAISLSFFLGLIERQPMLDLHERYRGNDPGLCDLLIRMANPRRLIELDLDAKKFKQWVSLAASLGDMGKDYVPSGKVESITVLYARPRWGTLDDWLNKQLKRWDQFTRSPNRYIEVAGEHHSLMEPEHISSFQAVLRAELARVAEGF